MGRCPETLILEPSVFQNTKQKPVSPACTQNLESFDGLGSLRFAQQRVACGAVTHSTWGKRILHLDAALFIKLLSYDLSHPIKDDSHARQHRSPYRCSGRINPSAA